MDATTVLQAFAGPLSNPAVLGGTTVASLALLSGGVARFFELVGQRRSAGHRAIQ